MVYVLKKGWFMMVHGLSCSWDQRPSLRAKSWKHVVSLDGSEHLQSLTQIVQTSWQRVVEVSNVKMIRR